MNREPQSATEAATGSGTTSDTTRAAPIEQPTPSVECDLQYVTIQLNGTTYGGWYRVLPDGQMQMLALASMRTERRTEGTVLEQARGMLTDVIHSAACVVENTKPATSDPDPVA